MWNEVGFRKWIKRAQTDKLLIIIMRGSVINFLVSQFLPEITIANQICYHYQQFAEKYLKAYLDARGQDADEHQTLRHHNLSELKKYCADFDPLFLKLDENDLVFLTKCETYRYNDDCRKDQIKKAREIVNIIKKLVIKASEPH